jgi:MFS family permease
MQGILSPLSGYISDNYQPRKIATFGLVLVFIAQVTFFFLPSNAEIPLLVLSLLLIGAGFGFFSAANKTAIMRSVVPEYHGTASSLATTVEQYGNLFSVGIASGIFALTLGNVAITPAVAVPFLSGFHQAFAVSLILCIIAIAFSLLRGDLPVEERE